MTSCSPRATSSPARAPARSSTRRRRHRPRRRRGSRPAPADHRLPAEHPRARRRSRARRGCGRRGPRCRRFPTATSATPTRAVCGSCAPPSPTTSAGSAGSSPSADQVVICNGFSHGLSLVARQLLDAGHTHDRRRGSRPRRSARRARPGSAPSHRGRRRSTATASSSNSCAGRRPARCCVTPAHQYPTGAVLAPPRRRAVVAWARDVDGYVIEDDYDAEYRYDRHPVGAMQGLAPDRVIYCGTLSKSLAPGLRLGWLVLPPPLVAPIAAKPHADRPRHVGARAGDVRRVPRQRRPRPSPAADAADLPGAARRARSPPSPGGCPTPRPSGIAAGLHVLVTLPPRVDEAALAERAAAAGHPGLPARRRTASREPPALPRRSSSATAISTPPAIEAGRAGSWPMSSPSCPRVTPEYGVQPMTARR